ncbi:MAG: lipoate--protein ligase family protein [Heliobacteriaceae bacterium]|jgi:lipoate-protein ligase A|nr:lipoate--protein ligase family protein [Heliobacteriaceae bacterium]
MNIYTGAQNMKIDSDMLDYAIANKLTEPLFRLYGWFPACVSLGRNQKDDFVNYEFLKANNIDVVRRLTGGRALLHDNEITYCYVCPQGVDSVTDSYKKISQVLIDAFAAMDIPLEFGGIRKPGHFDYCMLVSTGADLCYQGKKLIGSAQFRKEGYILQHGSILYDYDADLLEKVFGEKVDKSAVTSIKEIAPRLTKDALLQKLNMIPKIMQFS